MNDNDSRFGSMMIPRKVERAGNSADQPTLIGTDHGEPIRHAPQRPKPESARPPKVDGRVPTIWDLVMTIYNDMPTIMRSILGVLVAIPILIAVTTMMLQINIGQIVNKMTEADEDVTKESLVEARKQTQILTHLQQNMAEFMRTTADIDARTNALEIHQALLGAETCRRLGREPHLCAYTFRKAPTYPLTRHIENTQVEITPNRPD